MDMQTIPVPRYAYSLTEAELASGLSRSSLYRLMARGVFTTIKRGNRRLVPAEELRRLCGSKPNLENQPVPHWGAQNA